MTARDDYPAIAKVLNAKIKWTDESIAAEMDHALDEIDRLRQPHRTAYKTGYIDGYDDGASGVARPANAAINV